MSSSVVLHKAADYVDRYLRILARIFHVQVSEQKVNKIFLASFTKKSKNNEIQAYVIRNNGESKENKQKQ
jgi:hypothetical protein